MRLEHASPSPHGREPARCVIDVHGPRRWARSTGHELRQHRLDLPQRIAAAPEGGAKPAPARQPAAGHDQFRRHLRRLYRDVQPGAPVATRRSRGAYRAARRDRRPAVDLAAQDCSLSGTRPPLRRGRDRLPLRSIGDARRRPGGYVRGHERLECPCGASGGARPRPRALPVPDPGIRTLLRSHEHQHGPTAAGLRFPAVRSLLDRDPQGLFRAEPHRSLRGAGRRDAIRRVQQRDPAFLAPTAPA